MPDSDDKQAGPPAVKTSAEVSKNIAVAEQEPVAAAKPEPKATALEIPSVKTVAAPKPIAVTNPTPPKAAKTIAAMAKVAPKAKVMPKPVAAPDMKSAPMAQPAVKTAPARIASLTSISPKIAFNQSTATTPPAEAANKDQAMTISSTNSGFESIISDAQTKAKDAFEKSAALFGDYADFAKGNVEAVVQSGKILAEGLQGMGSTLVAESRTAFETATADIKGMAAVKSPTDLFQLQSEMIRKSFDTAVAYGSKNTEAMIKLVSEAMSPLSSRMTLAVEKVRTATN